TLPVTVSGSDCRCSICHPRTTAATRTRSNSPTYFFTISLLTLRSSEVQFLQQDLQRLGFRCERQPGTSQELAMQLLEDGDGPRHDLFGEGQTLLYSRIGLVLRPERHIRLQHPRKPGQIGGERASQTNVLWLLLEALQERVGNPT